MAEIRRSRAKGSRASTRRKLPSYYSGLSAALRASLRRRHNEGTRTVAVLDIATDKLLREPEPSIKPRMVVFHTMVGSLQGTDSFFRHTTSLEAHFGIGGPSDGDLDGAIWQWVDTDRRAQANARANEFAISIETSDGGDPHRPWSPNQVDAMVRLTERLCGVHGIPRRVVTSWNDPEGGLGWHVMFGAPSNWTPVVKTCPGPVRISQLKSVVFPRLGIHDQDPLVIPVVDPPWPGVVFGRGVRGDAVCAIQTRLRSFGLSIDTVFGCPFGPQTENAVRAFQTEHGLGVDGKVGRSTWTALFKQ